MFRLADQEAPSIVFIDEIDAVRSFRGRFLSSRADFLFRLAPNVTTLPQEEKERFSEPCLSSSIRYVMY
jgi:SpoVK/Ycf46/Vps4 family AAA+-type ATPase